MNWDYIAGFFDGEGNIHILKVKGSKDDAPQLGVMVRIYQNSKDILEEMKIFLGCGTIYQKKSNGVFELTFNKKENVKSFLSNLRGRAILKGGQIDYLLENYKFNRGENNYGFDVDKFRSFITRKNTTKFRKLHTFSSQQ